MEYFLDSSESVQEDFPVLVVALAWLLPGKEATKRIKISSKSNRICHSEYVEVMTTKFDTIEVSHGSHIRA